MAVKDNITSSGKVGVTAYFYKTGYGGTTLDVTNYTDLKVDLTYFKADSSTTDVFEIWSLTDLEEELSYSNTPLGTKVYEVKKSALTADSDGKVIVNIDVSEYNYICFRPRISTVNQNKYYNAAIKLIYTLS